MNAEIRNSQQDVCRILSMGLRLRSGRQRSSITARKLPRCIDVRVHEQLNIFNPEQFRSSLHDLCERELLAVGG